jgi:ParB-like chromosome segregation protein Spo0J
MEKPKRSIRGFEMPQPVLVNRSSGQVVGGHQRLKAAMELGWDRVPVTYVDLTEERGTGAEHPLNNNELAGEWNLEQLAKVLRDITDAQTLEAHRIRSEGDRQTPR